MCENKQNPIHVDFSKIRTHSGPVIIGEAGAEILMDNVFVDDLKNETMCENCRCGSDYQPTDGNDPGTAPKPNKTINHPIQASNADHMIVDDMVKYNSDGVSRELVLKQELAGGRGSLINSTPALDAVRSQLRAIGEDPDREGLLETPNRVVKSWLEIFSGYGKDPKDVMKVFDSAGADQIVLVANIELYSMCEHHLLPFFGVAHVAYIPNGKVIGLSKLARLVDIFARRAQIQERIGEQVTAALMEHLKPLGAACVIEAQHMCMQMRGVSKQNSHTVTSSMKGAFMDKPAAREELLQLIQMRKK